MAAGRNRSRIPAQGGGQDGGDRGWVRRWERRSCACLREGRARDVFQRRHSLTHASACSSTPFPSSECVRASQGNFAPRPCWREPAPMLPDAAIVPSLTAGRAHPVAGALGGSASRTAEPDSWETLVGTSDSPLTLNVFIVLYVASPVRDAQGNAEVWAVAIYHLSYLDVIGYAERSVLRVCDRRTVYESGIKPRRNIGLASTHCIYGFFGADTSSSSRTCQLLHGCLGRMHHARRGLRNRTCALKETF